MSSKANTNSTNSNSVSSLGSYRSNNTLEKRLPFPKKLIKSLEKFRDNLGWVERGKTAITNLISLLNEYNQVIKTNNSHQIQPIINKLAPIFTTSNGGRSNIYHKLGGLSSLNTYMQIRKIRTKYYLGNTEISKDDITVFLLYFIGNNNIKSTNLNNLNNVGKNEKIQNEKLYENMYLSGISKLNIRRSLEEKEKYSKTAIYRFMSKFGEI